MKLPAPSATAPQWRLRRGLTAAAKALAGDRLLLALLTALALFAAFGDPPLASYPARVDWPTVATLCGLLVLTTALQQSGALQRLGAWMLARVSSERALALTLVSASALLSMLLTNDVALFVVVPLTIGVCRGRDLPCMKLIVFEALAVNTGSALTPIGNPQNLFLWQSFGVPFGAFVLHMLPLVALLGAMLLGATVRAFDKRSVRVAEDAAAPLDTLPMALALALYLPFLVAADRHLGVWAAAAVLLVFAVVRPVWLLRVDWALLLVFVLMFIDLRLLADTRWMQQAMAQLQLHDPKHLYGVAIAQSQLISNVPATIALAGFSNDWRVLAYGANIGGYGLMIGSLANVIALRLARERGAWRCFHLYSIPALAVAAAAGYALLFTASPH